MTVLEIILAILLGAVLVALVFLYRAHARYKRELQQMIEQQAHLVREWPTLAHLTRHLEDDETRQLIKHRYNLVCELLAAVASGDTERSNAVMDSVEELVSDPAVFMRQLRLIYGCLQPAMISHLVACGLSDREVEICCLYALGLNGKAAQQYTRNGRHFQHVGEIRKKLGLGEHDRNIDGYIRSFLK